MTPEERKARRVLLTREYYTAVMELRRRHMAEYLRILDSIRSSRDQQLQ